MPTVKKAPTSLPAACFSVRLRTWRSIAERALWVGGENGAMESVEAWGTSDSGSGCAGDSSSRLAGMPDGLASSDPAAESSLRHKPAFTKRLSTELTPVESLGFSSGLSAD